MDPYDGLRAPVISRRTPSGPISAECVEKERDPETQSPYRCTRVLPMRYGNNYRLNFNHVSGTGIQHVLPPFCRCNYLIMYQSFEQGKQ